MRKKNIEIRKSTVKDWFEVVVWEENIYFEQEHKFSKSDDGEWYHFIIDGVLKENCRVNSKLFKAPELCCVIAYLKPDGNTFELEPLGDRLLELSKKDRKTFFKLSRKWVKSDVFA